MKRYTEKKAAAVFESVLSLVRKERGRRDVFSNAWKDGDGAGIVCDGYRLVKISAGIPAGVSCIIHSVPPTTSEELQRKAMRARIVDITLDAARRENYTSAEAITADYIKEHARPLSPCGRSAYVKYPGTETCYNARYLLQLVNLFPDACCFICKDKGRRSPLVIRSAHGAAYLMPYYVLETGVSGK